MGSDVGGFVNSNGNRNFAAHSASLATGLPLFAGGSKLKRTLADPLGLFAPGAPSWQPSDINPDQLYKNPQKAEIARQLRIKAGSSAVNQVFDDPAREANRQAFLTAMRDFYTSDANRQKAIADRNRKFSIARGGLTGGSADTDSNRLLGEEYVKGLLGAENKAQGAYNDLVGRDEAARGDILAAVRAGMDTTTAASRSAGLMANNAAGAQTDAMVGGLGDVFGGTAAVYKTQRDAADRRRGVLDAYGSLYGNKNPYG